MTEEAAGYRVDGQRVDSLQLDGEAVVLNLISHGYFGLNQTGTDVWDLVKAHEGISALEIAAAVGSRYDRAFPDVIGDVTALLEELERHDLVARCPSAPAPAARLASNDQPYVVPRLEVYGNLDTLILSGE